MRGHSKPSPLAIAREVREMLGIKPLPDVEPSLAEALPIDPLADLDATRAVLKKIRAEG